MTFWQMMRDDFLHLFRHDWMGHGTRHRKCWVCGKTQLDTSAGWVDVR